MNEEDNAFFDLHDEVVRLIEENMADKVKALAVRMKHYPGLSGLKINDVRACLDHIDLIVVSAACADQFLRCFLMVKYVRSAMVRQIAQPVESKTPFTWIIRLWLAPPPQLINTQQGIEIVTTDTGYVVFGDQPRFGVVDHTRRSIAL